MGVMNITPDSFSDGGHLYSNSGPDLAKAIDRASGFVSAGASWLDVGGESTRPGAARVELQEELSRVLPVIEAIAERFETGISVDTSQPQVIRQAAAAGASMVNDTRALQAEGALQAAVENDMAACFMHMQGAPHSMQDAPAYGNVTEEVREFLVARLDAAQAAGMHRDSICIDPGFGFGKTLEHNLQLLKQLPELVALGYPVLVGFSRKSMIGQMTGRTVDQRDASTQVLNTLALQRGASIFRVHDVSPATDMIRIWEAIQNHGNSG